MERWNVFLHREIWRLVWQAYQGWRRQRPLGSFLQGRSAANSNDKRNKWIYIPPVCLEAPFSLDFLEARWGLWAWTSAMITAGVREPFASSVVWMDTRSRKQVQVEMRRDSLPIQLLPKSCCPNFLDSRFSDGTPRCLSISDKILEWLDLFPAGDGTYPRQHAGSWRP